MSSSATSQNPRKRTLADFLAMPEEERFHELIDGELVDKAAPTFQHGKAQGRTFHLLQPYDRRPGGRLPGGWWFATEVEVQFGEDVLRPDVAGWRRDRIPEQPQGSPILLRPDWVCEVLSTNKRNDLIRKKYIYHQHQVGHYWLLDPMEETLAVYRWHPDGYLEVLVAARGQRVRAEPFDVIDLPVGAFFGDDEEEH